MVGSASKHLERPEPEHLVLDVAHQRASLGRIDDDVFLEQQPLDELAQLLAQALLRHAFQGLEVDALQQQLVHSRLQPLVDQQGLGRGVLHAVLGPGGRLGGLR
jgi:hypothetical protein